MPNKIKKYIVGILINNRKLVCLFNFIYFAYNKKTNQFTISRNVFWILKLVFILIAVFTWKFQFDNVLDKLYLSYRTEKITNY